MVEKTLRGDHGQYLGTVSTDNSGNKTLRGDHGQYLGCYSAAATRPAATMASAWARGTAGLPARQKEEVAAWYGGWRLTAK